MKPKFETNNGVDQEKIKLISDVREFVESKGLHVMEPTLQAGEIYRIQILKEEKTNPIWGEEFEGFFEELKNKLSLNSSNIEIVADNNIKDVYGVVHVVFKPRQIH